MAEEESEKIAEARWLTSPAMPQSRSRSGHRARSRPRSRGGWVRRSVRHGGLLGACSGRSCIATPEADPSAALGLLVGRRV